MSHPELQRPVLRRGHAATVYYDNGEISRIVVHRDDVDSLDQPNLRRQEAGIYRVLPNGTLVKILQEYHEPVVQHPGAGSGLAATALRPMHDKFCGCHACNWNDVLT